MSAEPQTFRDAIRRAITSAGSAGHTVQSPGTAADYVLDMPEMQAIRESLRLAFFHRPVVMTNNLPESVARWVVPELDDEVPS